MHILKLAARVSAILLLLTGCGGTGTLNTSDIGGPWQHYEIDPQTSPDTISSCEALNIGKEVYNLLGKTTLVPRLNEADNIMCAFVIEETGMSAAELEEYGMTPVEGERVFPDFLLVTVSYDEAEGFAVLYPEVRPDGGEWGKSKLGDNAKWWTKDPLKNGEYGNGLGILSGTTMIQISTGSRKESDILNEPQGKYEDLGRKILDGPYVNVDPR